MSKNVEDMNVEERKEYEESLDKTIQLNSIKDKQKLVEEAKEKENTEAEEKKTQEAKEHDAQVIADYKALNPEVKPEDEPVDKITDENGEVKGNSDNKNVAFINGYYKRNTTALTKSDRSVKLEEKPDEILQMTDSFENTTWDKMFENTDSDSGCEDIIGDWSPADVYSKIIWNTFVCKADLFKICVKGLAIKPGEGLKTQIRVYGNLSDPDVKGSCECLTCVSIPFTTHTLTLEQIGKEAIICEKDIWEVGSVLMDAYLTAFSDMWASWFDKEIYDEIETASPGTTETLGTALNCDPSTAGSCCSDTALVQMYHAVQEIVASMREGTNPYQPDYIVMSPTVASVFKRLQTPTRVMGYDDISWDADGRLNKIGSLKVIEYCRANTCSDASGEVMAVIVDSRRAVGAVFGHKPKTYKFFQSNCNSHRIDSWAFFACAELDVNAIAHIVNP
jgi:hypothetical protein